MFNIYLARFKMNTRTATLSLRRHDSSELEPIDISSSGPRSKFYTKCAKNGKGWSTVVPGTLHDDILDEENLDAVGKSWCISKNVFLTLRFVLFQYLFATFVLLITRDALRKFPLSMMVYLLQLAASLSAIASSVTLERSCKDNIRKRKGHLTPPAEKSQTRTSLHPGSRVSRISARLGRAMQGNCKTAVLILATVLIQNSSAIILFWDHLFLITAKDIQLLDNSDSISFVLLHLYNLIPVLFELVFGCTVFKLVYFIPGVAVIAGILVRLAASSRATSRDDAAEILELAKAITIHAGKGSSPVPYVFLSIIFVSICVGMLIFQRAQQRFLHR